VLQQVTQGGNRALNPREIASKRLKGGDQLLRVEGRERYTAWISLKGMSVCGTADDLGGRDLIRRIPAIAGLWSTSAA